MHNYEEARKTTKSIQKRYILAITIIAVLVISSHFIMEYANKKAEFDSRIINIAGRQRMLSQKITKCVFGLAISKNKSDKEKYIEELNKGLALWKKSHYGLKNGDSELGLPGKNSKIVVELFESIENNFSKIVKNTTEILEFTKKDGYSEDEITKRLFVIRENEVIFLPVMDKIVFQYDAEAKQKVKFNQGLNLLLGLLTLIALALEAGFIFKPLAKEVGDSIEELMEKEKNLKNMVLELEDRETKIKNQNEMLMEINQKILESINYAKIIQRSILPESLSDDKINKHIEYYTIWKPKDIVGGDFYWYKKINEKYYFALVDCTGHGVPGALMTMMVKASLDQISENKNKFSSSDLISSLNDFLKDSFNKSEIEHNADVGADIGVISLDLNTRKVVFSGAKINLYLIKDGKVEIIKGSKQSVGYSRSKKDYEYINTEIEIKEGDSFYMSSDGFIDQNGKDSDSSFGTKRFVALLESVQDKSMSEQRKIIEDTLEKHMDGEHQRDDITVFGLQCKRV